MLNAFSWSPFSLYLDTKVVHQRRWGFSKGKYQISRLFHAAEFISQRGYVRFVIAKLWCTSRLSPEANRTVAVRLSGKILEPVSYDYYTPTHTHMVYTLPSSHTSPDASVVFAVVCAHSLRNII